MRKFLEPLIYVFSLCMLATMLQLSAAGTMVQASPGDVVLVSSDSSGVEGNDHSGAPCMSPDGKYVAFSTQATNLVPGGTTGYQVFRKDLDTGAVTLVSCDSAGIQGNAGSYAPAMSPDGSYVVFHSDATSLVAGGTTGKQVFRKDLTSGAVTLVSCDAAGVEGNGTSEYATTSSDGRYIAFDSVATNLVTPATTSRQIFHKDLATGAVTLVSCDAAGVEGNTAGNITFNAKITPDGSYVGFRSDATNLIPGGTTNRQAFVKDIASGDVEIISCDSSVVQGDDHSGSPTLTPDLSYAVFASDADNLVAGSASSDQQIFRKDLTSGEVVLVSCDSAATLGNGASEGPAVNSDGSYVAFTSLSTNLIPGGTVSNRRSIFRKDLVTGEVVLASCDSSDTQADQRGNSARISSDGSYVAFASVATNLVTPSTTNWQLFRKELATSRPAVTSITPGSGTNDGTVNITDLAGSDFRNGATVALKASGEADIDATSVIVVSASRITCNFPLLGAETGTRDVVVRNPDGMESTLAGGFTVLPAVGQATISGRVTSPSEPGGIPNVSVYMLDLSNSLIKSAVTKSDGSYLALVPAPADYKIKFAAWGQEYLVEWFDGKNDFDSADTISVAEGESVTDINAFLTPAIIPTLTAISPNEGRNNGVVHITNLAGTDFQYGAMVKLSMTEQTDIFATNVTVVSSTRITCDLDLSRAQPGSWDVVAINPCEKQGVLPEGFSVLQAPGVVPPSPPSPPSASTFYFAEGYTGDGFQEYLCLGNPGDTDTTATITYMFPDGSAQQEQVPVPANSRNTVNVNQSVGEGREVSCKVEADQVVVCERPMYFSYGGAWSGGHNAVGAISPSKEWYFAEGYTGEGFDEWICVLNPGDSPANLTFSFQTQEAGLIQKTGYSVPAHSRGSFKINDVLGPDYQTSLKLASDVPVVAERPMYFDYSGMGAWHWQGGHCVMGAPSLSKEYYFAEGTTRSGFEEWITLQNPNGEEISVDATYQLGQGNPVPATYDLAPNTRRTVFVPHEVGEDRDVSVHLVSESDFLAERPTYFSYSYMDLSSQGGHCVIGATSPATGWFLAEGCTRSGFNQWICLQNAGTEDAMVQITYYTQEAGALAPKELVVPAGTRRTVMVNNDAGSGYQLSCGLSSDKAIVVERPMYFVCGGCPGGHDVVGYTP